MIYGLYLSAQGADLQARRLEVISHNLANASTTAFKRDLAVFQAQAPRDLDQGQPQRMPEPLKEMPGGVSLVDVYTDYTNGPPLPTGNSLDVALLGPGFFSVGVNGQELLTRNGKFSLDPAGTLVMQDTGYPVLDPAGNSISLPIDSGPISISDEGTIFSAAPGGAAVPIGRIGLVDVDDPQTLLKVGQGIYQPQTLVKSASPDTRMVQGFVEGSGTEPVQEMLQMITTSREFEVNMNMIKFQDEALGSLLQAVPRR